VTPDPHWTGTELADMVPEDQEISGRDGGGGRWRVERSACAKRFSWVTPFNGDPFWGKGGWTSGRRAPRKMLLCEQMRLLIACFVLLASAASAQYSQFVQNPESLFAFLELTPDQVSAMFSLQLGLGQFIGQKNQRATEVSQEIQQEPARPDIDAI